MTVAAHVRSAGIEDVDAAARLLHDFNVEFDSPTPDVGPLAVRCRELLEGGDTEILLAGDDADPPSGIAVLRFRLSIWNPRLECYLAELYVVPSMRRQGLGRALMEAAMTVARERGADSMDLGTEESDTAARALYESLGFTNREGGADGPLMFIYEREL